MKNLADRMQNTNTKRKRTVLTARQHETLAKAFEECPFPDGEARLTLGKGLNMSSRTVQIWFQNQRQKTKTLHNDSHRHSEISDENHDNQETLRIFSPYCPTKSLNVLAEAACIEYDKKEANRIKKCKDSIK